MVTGRFSRPDDIADLVLLLASDVSGERHRRRHPTRRRSRPHLVGLTLNHMSVPFKTPGGDEPEDGCVT
jgi:hypothetical protein